MRLKKIWKYFFNCFLLLIPVFIWNLVFINYLPKGYTPSFFWKDIPVVIGTTENILRIIVFLIPLIMVFSIKTKQQKIGFIIYLIGIAVYFLSWIVQIYFQQNSWSISQIGFMAPAYTTLIWFVGIGLIGKDSFLKIPYMSAIYVCLSTVFVIFHSIHCYIVFQRL